MCHSHHNCLHQVDHDVDHHGSGHLIPCLRCQPRSFIRLVQHLIERCLMLHMSKEQCVESLALHASIPPPVTLTVWRELEKENMDFFMAYHSRPTGDSQQEGIIKTRGRTSSS